MPKVVRMPKPPWTKVPSSSAERKDSSWGLHRSSLPTRDLLHTEIQALLVRGGVAPFDGYRRATPSGHLVRRHVALGFSKEKKKEGGGKGPKSLGPLETQQPTPPGALAGMFYCRTSSFLRSRPAGTGWSTAHRLPFIIPSSTLPAWLPLDASLPLSSVSEDRLNGTHAEPGEEGERFCFSSLVVWHERLTRALDAVGGGGHCGGWDDGASDQQAESSGMWCVVENLRVPPTTIY